MISVAVLSGGAAAVRYYTRAEGCERELLQELTPATVRELDGEPDPAGYYVNGHDRPGEWVGRGAHALGLTGRFDDDAGRVLQELLAGRHEGQTLAQPVWRRGENGARVDVRRSGFDVTFSAPKSVSVLMALADPAIAREVVAAHHAAATEALGLLESLSARAARGHQGDGKRAPRIATEGFVAAAFTHTTSRALDPQLHTHMVIANLARGTDGRWSALDSRTLHREAITASAVYHHRLRAELTERLGVRWTAIERGVAEIEGIGQKVRREFSTRRRQIEDALAVEPPAQGGGRRTPQQAAQAACLKTRPVKTHAPAEQLRQDWADRAEAAGLSRARLAALLEQRATPPAPSGMATFLDRVLSREGVTREEATFSQGELLRELIAQLPPGSQITTSELLDLTAALVRSNEVVPVLTGDGHGYTTRDLLQTEAQTLALATRSDSLLGALDRQHVARLLTRDLRLRGEQRDLAFTLLTRGLPVDVISGPAGCGKTAGLAFAVRAWSDAGFEVRGTAVAALTAHGLELASGAPSVSLTRAVSRPEQHLPVGGVLLVDEAGMIGTRPLHDLLTLARERQCKVVLVGDPQQLPELEAGGMFARLTREPHTLSLDGHHRQQQPWERAALDALRHGDIATALETYQRRQRLHTRDDPLVLRDAAVTAYLDSRAEQPDPWQSVLLASSREEVRALNDLVQQRLLATGTLGHAALQVETRDGPVDFHESDQVLVTRNDHRQGLLNGTTALVTRVHRDGLTLQTSRGQVRVGRDWLDQDRLDHGYAMTLHKAQGRTVHTAFVVGNDSLSAQAGYVGLSPYPPVFRLWTFGSGWKWVLAGRCMSSSPGGAGGSPLLSPVGS